MKKNSFSQPILESETIESLSEKLLTTTAQLMNANKELQLIQKERSEMLSNISHDLRAPITAIRSCVDYLLAGKDLSADDYTSALKMIDRRTKTLEDLIQDMYYLFCVEDTSKELSLQAVPAAAFLEEYFYDAIVDTRYDNHQMHLAIAEDVTCYLKIDLPKIVRVLDNLFTNAAKYSPEGSDITLQASMEPASMEPASMEAANTLTISVIDNGIGIPADALSHLFSRTYTVSTARTPNSATGSGLGLSIAKTIVERHHGTIRCSSREGEGSCFSFTLPCFSEV